MTVSTDDKLSAAEQTFENLRGWIGLIAAPLVFLLILNAPGWQMPPEAQRLAAVMATVMVLWITEPIPMPVSALLGACACVILKVADPKTVFAPFADPLIFLFIGSFFLAQAIFLHKLDRRLAYGVLSWSWVGSSPARILFAYGAITAAISGWISNTATTAMMLAIGLSIIRFLNENAKQGGSPVNPSYATGLMLMTSFAASIGGLATPVGTPPNLIGIGFIKSQLGTQISFFQWCLIGIPLVIVLYFCLFAYMNFFCRAGISRIQGCAEMLQTQRREMGPWTTGQISTLVAFIVMVSLWLIPGLISLLEQSSWQAYHNWTKTLTFAPAEFARRVPESVAALLGAILLFFLPGHKGERALTWKEAVNIEWGVIFIYGGGYTLGVLSEKTGLGTAMGKAITTWIPGTGSWELLIISCLVAVLISELTSNTAAVTIVVPVVIALAKETGLNPVEPALGAVLASSLGFMLPVSTPCNAIVYGSGLVPISRMIRYGLILDGIGIIVIVLGVKLLLPLLGLNPTP